MYKNINMSNIILILLFMHTCLNIVANDFVWNTSDAWHMGTKETQNQFYNHEPNQNAISNY